MGGLKNIKLKYILYNFIPPDVEPTCPPKVIKTININIIGIEKFDTISSLLEDKGLEMIVTPKQIDEDIRNISYIIGNSINESLHLNSYEL